MAYRDTFIEVAPDCPVPSGIVPVARGERKPLALIEYELLSGEPYAYTQDDLIFAVHIRHKGVSAEELAARGPEIRAALLAKPHPCLRASLLPKRYGWGVHYDDDGKIALFPRDSESYRRFVETRAGTKGLLTALRNKRG